MTFEKSIEELELEIDHIYIQHLWGRAKGPNSPGIEDENYDGMQNYFREINGSIPKNLYEDLAGRKILSTE